MTIASASALLMDQMILEVSSAVLGVVLHAAAEPIGDVCGADIAHCVPF
jgi:hypothetical protein